MCRAAALAVLVLAVTVPGRGHLQADNLSQLSWRLDSLERIGGHPVRVLGTPLVVDSDLGPVVAFNGTTDGVFIDVNPLEGLAQFTLEVVFQPDVDGPEEQRFVHVEESGTGNRALVELRLTRGRWALDTYLRAGDAGLTLLDRTIDHAAGGWHTAALTYDGSTMAHFVDGVREMSGEIRFPPLRAGATSIGVRQNRVSWFKGRIHSVRVTPRALPAEELLMPPKGNR